MSDAAEIFGLHNGTHGMALSACTHVIAEH